MSSYLRHLSASEDLITSYEARRTGFIELALEKNKRATPFVEQARSLRFSIKDVRAPLDLVEMKEIRSALIRASGLSDKAEAHLKEEDKISALNNFIDKFLLPAGDKFRDEVVFRFLLTEGDALGGSMRNIAGSWAQQKRTSAIIASLKNAGIKLQVLIGSNTKWIDGDDSIASSGLKGIRWFREKSVRTVLFNLKVRLVGRNGNNVDVCLFRTTAEDVRDSAFQTAAYYLALGELKGGIDPAGADEHWKTANTALSRIRESFARASYSPALFFVGAAIEPNMAKEIWEMLESGILANAGNLTNTHHVDSVCQWLTSL